MMIYKKRLEIHFYSFLPINILGMKLFQIFHGTPEPDTKICGVAVSPGGCGKKKALSLQT